MLIKHEYRIYRDEVSPKTLENITNDLLNSGHKLIRGSDHLRFIKYETVELFEDIADQEEE